MAGGGGSRGAYDCLTSALILSNCGLNVLRAVGKYGNKIRGILSVTRFLAELTARCWLTKAKEISLKLRWRKKGWKREAEEAMLSDVMDRAKCSLCVLGCNSTWKWLWNKREAKPKKKQKESKKKEPKSTLSASSECISKAQHTSVIPAEFMHTNEALRGTPQNNLDLRRHQWRQP